jgi:hypothetical protein
MYSFALLLALPLVSLAADNVLLTTAPDGSTIARNASGVALWQDFNRTSGSATRIATRARATPLSVTMPVWDPIVNLDPSASGGSLAGPIFDSSGNAWVVINDSVNLVAIQSNGTSGTWLAPHIIGPSLPGGIETVGMAVDQAGGFYVTYGTAASVNTADPLMWTKYTPAAGWQAAAQIYNSPAYFDETFPEIDSAGRLVVVFNANGISSIASTTTQTAWGAVQTISPLSDEPLLPSVAANPSGTRLALVYLLLKNIAQKGLRYTFFNSTTGEWGASTPVPNSGDAYFSGYTSENAYPIAVDSSGNVTVATPVLAGFSHRGVSNLSRQYSVGGFRYENGVWSMQQLGAPSYMLPSLESFGSTALNANGSVLISVPWGNGLSETVSIIVFRYTPGVGWDTEIAASGASNYWCKVAWFEGTEAVVVYSAGGQLLAALYSNGAWGPAPAIPGNFPGGGDPALAGAPTGEVLLGIPANGIYVTFLRP